MKIGIIGWGNVGGSLGKAWAKNGHAIFFGVRNIANEDLNKLLREIGPRARAGSVQEAASASELILLATPWDAAGAALQSAGNLSGKILIDATNPLFPDYSGLVLGTTTSAGETVATWARGAKVVKAFNTVGSNVMANSRFPQGRVAMFYCGDDATAKKVVAGLATELGFEALDAGPLSNSRWLEAFAMLWISMAYQQGLGREIAFQFMRR